MSFIDAPLLGLSSRFGPPDRAFDLFMATGPILVLLIVVAGRNALTAALAALYVVSFAGYVAYKGVRS